VNDLKLSAPLALAYKPTSTYSRVRGWRQAPRGVSRLSARVAFLLTCPAPTPWGRTRSGPCYIDELLPDVHEGRIEPGRVFDQVTNLEGVPDGYRAMNEREAIKVLIEL
jgi:hypothetical protein